MTATIADTQPASDVATLEPAVDGRRRPPVGLVVAAALVAAVFALPLGYLVWENLSAEESFVSTLSSARASEPLLRTLVLATTVSVATAVLGTALAWLLVRTDLPGRRWLRLVAPLPLVIPSYVGALALLAAFAPGGLIARGLELVGVDQLPRVEGFWAAAIVLTLFTYPYVYLPVAARLATLPVSIEESARSLGRSPRGVFFSIVVPQCSGAVTAGALLVFLYSLSEFGAVQLLHYDTLTRVIFSSRLFEPELAIALSMLLAFVAIVVVLAARAVGRRRVHTEATSGGRRAAPAELRLWKAPALLLVGGVVFVALVAPVAVLAHWVIRGALGDADLRAGELVDPAWTSSWLGVVTAIVAVAVVLPVAFLTIRYRSRIGGVANGLVMSGFALPGLVLALSLVFLSLRTAAFDWLYLTYPLLVFAYVVHFGAQAVQTSQVAVSGVPERLGDAARSLGAGRIRRLWTVEVPLMRPGLAAGAGLVLLSTMKELPATLVLAPIGTETLATRIWSATEDGFFAEAGLAALVLVAISGLLTWLLTVRRLDREIGGTASAAREAPGEVGR